MDKVWLVAVDVDSNIHNERAGGRSELPTCDLFPGAIPAPPTFAGT